MAIQEKPKFNFSFQSSSGERLKPNSNYSLRDNSKLTNFVDGIRTNGPKGFIQPWELERLSDNLDANRIIRELPPGITEDDFVGILKLSMLTECATDTYGVGFTQSSAKYKQPWLARFTEDVWMPDEYSHREPFKNILMQIGFSEGELDREMRETQEKEFTLVDGYTPIHLTTYGMDQEDLTDNWYGLIIKMVRPASLVTAQVLGRVKQRETLHTIWYRDMTALQLEENPNLVAQVAEADRYFKLPGNILLPNLQGKANDWALNMGIDMERVRKDLIKRTSEALGSPYNLGRFVMEIAEQKGIKIGPFNASHVQAALNRFGKPAYGIIGEALLESVGIDKPFRNNNDGVVNQIRGVIRSWVTDQITHNI